MNDRSPHDTPDLAAWLREDRHQGLSTQTAQASWERAAHEATRTGLAGLVLERCRKANLQPPSAEYAALHRTATAVAASNLHLQQELGGLLRAFNNASIPVMLLKGAALNLTVYDRLDLRPMSDLDLLIGPHNIRDALHVLTNIGCRQERPLVRRDFFPKYYYETELLTAGPRPARIDLHVRPLRPLRMARTIPSEALWTGAKRVSVAGATAWVPRNEVMFVHLAAHSAFHGCSRLIWLYDLKRLVDVAGDSMDWNLVPEICRAWRLSLPVRAAIDAATTRLGPFVPDRLVRRLAVHDVSWKDRLTLAHAPRDASNPVSHVFVDLLCTPGVRFRVGYLWAILRPDRNHLKELYPFRHPGWRVLAHVWRSIRAVMRVIGGLGTLVRRAPRTLLYMVARRTALGGSHT